MRREKLSFNYKPARLFEINFFYFGSFSSGFYLIWEQRKKLFSLSSFSSSWCNLNSSGSDLCHAIISLLSPLFCSKSHERDKIHSRCNYARAWSWVFDLFHYTRQRDSDETNEDFQIHWLDRGSPLNGSLNNTRKLIGVKLEKFFHPSILALLRAFSFTLVVDGTMNRN